jgi:hypothetical protein
VFWRFCVLLAWAGAMVGFAALDSDIGGLFIWGGVIATVVAGAVVARGWALLAPVVFSAVYFAIIFVQDPSCSDCTEDTWGTIAELIAVFFTVPAVLAMGVGVGLRRRFTRSDPDAGTGAEHPREPPHSPPHAPAAP